ncbi:MAG: ABC transporter permease, partial [Acidimicrobiia bacterium]|nr:ABC transporter permease [Acidimicrobiia bacterium]
MMQPAFTIAAKDLKLRVRDRSAFIVGIIAPLGLAAIFSSIFNPIENFDFSATYAVVDQDGGVVARQFIGALEQFGGAKVTITKVATREEAVALADVEPFSAEEGVDAAFVIPVGFSDAIQSENPAELEVISSQGGVGADVAVSFAEQFASEMTYARIAVSSFESLGGTGDRSAAGLRALAAPPPVALEDVKAVNKELAGKTFYAAGLAIFFLFFTVQFGVNSLLEERHAGTLSRLMAAPMRRSSIIAGKGIMSFVLGFVSMVVLVIATTLLFGAEWGNPFGVLLLTVAAIISALGIMAVVAGFAKSAEQAQNYSSMVA